MFLKWGLEEDGGFGTCKFKFKVKWSHWQCWWAFGEKIYMVDRWLIVRISYFCNWLKKTTKKRDVKVWKSHGCRAQQKVKNQPFSPNSKYQIRFKKERCFWRRLGVKVALWWIHHCAGLQAQKAKFFQHQKKSLYTDESSL